MIASISGMAAAAPGAVLVPAPTTSAQRLKAASDSGALQREAARRGR
jgi:hypothetical protein